MLRLIPDRGVSRLKVHILPVFAVMCAGVLAEPVAMPPEAILDHYCAAEEGQRQLFRGVSMEVEIAASLPSLKKTGKLHALRNISKLGRITYQILGFEGDNTVKKEVIARYLTAEAEAQKEQPASLAVTPANYKFKYRGRGQFEGRDVHMFQVTPRQKRQGMYKGEVWIDAATYLRVRESGYLVKNPSLFLKRVAFVRNYAIRDGISVPLHTQSVVETRLVGKAELIIDYTNFSGPAAALGDYESQ
jgi:hypothetical protein